MRHYDKGGWPISQDRFLELFQDDDYRRIGATDLGGIWVSTVWLGLDHSSDDSGPPLIFETMVFDSGGSRDDYFVARYTTEARAVAGHIAVVAMVRKALIDAGSDDDLLSE